MYCQILHWGFLADRLAFLYLAPYLLGLVREQSSHCLTQKLLRTLCNKYEIYRHQSSNCKMQ